jgi:hypothetical protein
LRDCPIEPFPRSLWKLCRPIGQSLDEKAGLPHLLYARDIRRNVEPDGNGLKLR